MYGVVLPGGAVVKNPPASAGIAGDVGLIPGLGRSLGVGNGNPLQYSHYSPGGFGECISVLSSSVVAAAAAAKSRQSCPTLCDPIDGSPPGSPVRGILQATLEWVAMPSSRGSSGPRD